MKILIETSTKEKYYKDQIAGLIVSLKDFAVQSEIYYSLEEINQLVMENPTLEIFVNMNKNIFNSDLTFLEKTLLELEKINIKGILFYDLAFLKLKQELNLKNDLVWNQTHMVNNYKTCNYYYEKGVKYAYLGKEITLEEILEIINKTTITPMVEIVGYPTVAFSRRKLITNYYKDINKRPEQKLTVKEKLTAEDYELSEDENGTSFILKKITNATSIIKDLYNANLEYIVMKEYGLDSLLFEELLVDTKKYIEGNCQDQNYVNKYKKLGDSTNFFFKKTIYQVKKMDKIELLSPAGDLERLKVTLLYGADAVYIGGEKYSLRANATNFTLEEIKEGCTFAHQRNKKVYLTLNIVFHNEDMEGVEEYIRDVVDAGIDAFIVSDPFIISYIKKNFPKVEVHLSTQNSTTNYKAIEYFKDEGIDRVVLAREVSKNEIKEIIEKTKIDIEVFIHGAMCTCFSGRCALSNYVTNRDANRGGCSQVCRFAFETKEEKKFTMATKDNNLANYIGEMIDIGIKSLKVEGRMRSLYYLATVIGTYREIIDSYYENNLTKEKLELLEYRLSRVANREVSSHYFNKLADETDQYYTGRQEISNQDYLGLITGYDTENNCIILVERNYFAPGDQVELFTPTKDVYSYKIGKIYDDELNELKVANHPEQVLKLPFPKELPEYSMIRLIKKGTIITE